ncbi:hypothetical protein E7T06_14505 [Deinococcus sp. Arct2-2]|uniref:hypothetical protein n=1 Tax=Deinococcus sp. Arct2-2 TaxID=2568653 RepID=UPI0010A3C996|nr:hypothetical protein [Deinococcus sp. Arct2-2]THF68876.1 hypothetical protein E7T06_14505 [Deinococcus sp. Arct2-2]
MSMISRTATAGQSVFSQIYVLRLWHELSAEPTPGETWQASPFDPRSQRRWHVRSAAAWMTALTRGAPDWFQDDGELGAQA